MRAELIRHFVHISSMLFHFIQAEQDRSIDIGDIGFVFQIISMQIYWKSNFCSSYAFMHAVAELETLLTRLQ